MKKISMFKKIFLLLSLVNTVYSYGAVYQFEDGMPSNIKGGKSSKIEITEEKYKDGKHSLKWNFKGKDTLIISGDTGYKEFKKGGQEKAKASYTMWVYNKKPIKDKMLIEFKKDGKVKTSFNVNMNFEGWRTMWVQYDRDMTGTPVEGMDEIVLHAPNKDGEILIDQILTSVLIDPRHNARDEQVDFVNIEADTSTNAHWMALYKNYNTLEEKSSKKKVSKEERAGLLSIEKRFREDSLKNVKVNSKIIKENREILEKYKTKTISSPQTVVIYKKLTDKEKSRINEMDILEYGKWLRELSYMYNSTNNQEEKVEIFKIFEEGMKYLFDQGWAKGSGQGTIHHLGYQVRELYDAILLMKEPIMKSSIYNETKEMVKWYSALGIVYTPEKEIRGVNADVLNTMLPGMITAILLDEEGRAVQELRQLNKYLATSINYSPGLLGGFKEDGSMFHHMQNYPAYAKGAYQGLTPIIYYLGNTPFAFDERTYNTVKKSILMTRIYSNKYHYLLTLTGRHPQNTFKISDEVFRYAAYGKETGVDKELAEAYLRLNEKGKYADELKKLGFKPEKSPNGSWTMNMGSLQLQRRNEWLAGVKGFSRYLVGNEIYIKNNLYGRYMSYGAFQIVETSLKDSGFEHEGWSWSHYPGTTAINLPDEKLKSLITQIDTQSGIEEMLISDETYSGGNSLNNNGMFAMKLHENDKYNGSHRARKSVFFFDNRAILLGTNIENDDKEHETHTTLFQNALINKKMTPTEKTFGKNDFILDSQKNLYKIVDGNVVYRKSLQKSHDERNSKPTQNNYELAYINHGKNPENKTYEYSILIKGTNSEQEKFKKDAGYKVLQKDYKAHIVEDKVSNMRGYALFESGELKDDKYVKSVDTPSMILTAPNKNGLKLSFVDPDLRLYEGIDITQYGKNGKMIPVNIYSRKWNGNDSIPHTSTVVLNGKYNLAKENKNVSVQVRGNETIIKVTTRYAMPVDFELVNIK
ncbi:chondroitinase family polysaccharide lyase [Fusobacterium sp.]|uniref:chondroitinase family polysaccharide lyase n=1 Tax=Fusobacterium sp. TaxID=68766 RepID=UPI00260A324B|nr:chondroitinase family polysaccharide lyase [Fusobacterium sp.]